MGSPQGPIGLGLVFAPSLGATGTDLLVEMAYRSAQILVYMPTAVRLGKPLRLATRSPWQDAESALGLTPRRADEDNARPAWKGSSAG